MIQQPNNRPYWLTNGTFFSVPLKKMRLFFLIGCCVTSVNVKPINTAPILSSWKDLGQIHSLYNALKNKYSNHIHQFQTHSKATKRYKWQARFLCVGRRRQMMNLLRYRNTIGT